MAINNDTASMALFCDFENIALGVRDAQYEKFDIRPVLERLLAKGSIVVKKAYCDWDRYKGFKSAMHEANFELIEIPHVRQSGKNSADIRMVVDALDLCYTKSHVDTFVIISGDSDFSPLVSKLRENAKKVIGVGVKQSCSDLLVTNCDEFIYYDDLVRDREADRSSQRREREKRSPEEEARRREKQEERKRKALEIVHTTFADLMADRGDSDRIWASVLKEVVKRRNPGFNESYYGFRTFGTLLEEAAAQGLLGFGRDDKGAYVFRAPARAVASEGEMLAALPDGGEGAFEVAGMAAAGDSMPTSELPLAAESLESAAAEKPAKGRRRNPRTRRRNAGEELGAPGEVAIVPEAPMADVAVQAETAPEVGESRPEPFSEAPAMAPVETAPGEQPTPKRRGRKPARKGAASGSEPSAITEAQPPAAIADGGGLDAVPAPPPAAETGEGETPAKPKARRTPRARKPKAAEPSA